MRGLLLLYLGLWVFLGPATEDVEHISATLLRITNIKQIASKALGSWEEEIWKLAPIHFVPILNLRI